VEVDQHQQRDEQRLQRGRRMVYGRRSSGVLNAEEAESMVIP